MKREIREVNRESGIIRITTEDQRFYARRTQSSTGEVFWDFYPSVTWICGYYPKNERFMQWRGKVGNEGAEEAKEAGGEKGSKVHQAIGVLLAGGTVNLQDSMFENRHGDPEDLNAAEIECVMSFMDWYRATKPEVIAVEFTVWSEKYRYAGTVDLYCRIGGIPWIVDFKVSPNIYPSHEIQVSAYEKADGSFAKGTRLAILQLGYKKNKKQKYKFTPITKQFTLFMAARRMWANETKTIQPFQKDFPLELKLS